MKPTTLHTLLFTILFSAVSIFSANAQLTYSGGRLSLDTTPIGILLWEEAQTAVIVYF